MKQEQLKKAYTPVPEDFHQALYAAAHSVKEERKVKHTVRAVLIVVLITALLCGTAVALNNMSSVRNTWGGPAKTEEFLNHVTDLNQTYENEFIKLTLTDAVYDGLEFRMAMNLESRDEGKPVYLYPKITATSNGQALEYDVEGMTGDFLSGFLYPNLNEGDTAAGQYGFSGVLLDEAIPGNEVVWTFTMKVLKPNWPISDYTDLPQTSDGMTAEAYLEPFYKAYDQQRILTSWGDCLVEFGCAAEQGVDFGDREYVRLEEALVECGAFSLIDTIVYTFTTPVPESFKPKAVQGKTVTFDDFTLQIENIDIAFMRLDYLMTLIPAKPETEEILRRGAMQTAFPINFALVDEEGNPLYTGSTGGSSKELGDGTWGLELHGSLTIDGQLPQKLIFAPTHWVDNNPHVVDMQYSFTVELK